MLSLIFYLSLFVMAIWVFIQWDQSRIENQVEKTSQRPDNSNPITDYNSQNIRRSVVQALETMQIMVDSKNIDTIIGRSDFLKERMQVLSWNCIEHSYATDVQYGLDAYKSTYYNRDIQGWQGKAVMEPNAFDVHEFCAKALYNGFIKHYEDQEDQISNLKQKAAIKNRYKKLIEKIHEFTEHFDVVWGSALANKLKIEKLPEINAIEKEINKKINNL